MANEASLAKGTTQERKTYWEVKKHYDLSREDLEARFPDWNKKDELFRSHINQRGWPYSAMVFDPRVFTAIFEKSARMFSNKPRGRLIPREGGDVLGSRINNALLDFQWDDAERIDGEPMLSKWARMDMNARKYGASFAKCTWHFERRGEKRPWFDGPSFTPWNNRDVLHNPGYSSIKNWIQLREWITLQELKEINDISGRKPIYKNLDIIMDSLDRETRGGGDMRSTAWQSRNLSIKNLQDFRGRDEVFKTFEMVTEYRRDRWVTFAPQYGVILRERENPYHHGRIPVVQLKYYPIDEDIYGLSEIEPVEKLQKAINALVNQYLDAINMSLYTPIKVRTAAVQMHTLQFGPGKMWLMNDPSSDVLPYQAGDAGVAEFASTYRFLIGALQEGLGEASAAVSQLAPGQGERTATEINELALQRSVRDNFNQIFLSESIKDQMTLWLQMNQQFLFDNQNKERIIRVVGREAVTFFKEMGLDQEEIPLERAADLASPEMEDVLTDPSFDLSMFTEPLFPVSTPEGNVPKMKVDEDGVDITVLAQDISGNFDYIPDVRSMSNPEPAMVQALSQLVQSAKDADAVTVRQIEGKRLKLSEVEQDLFELLGLKDAGKYYERSENVQQPTGQTIPPASPGTGAAQGGQNVAGFGGTPGVSENTQAISGGTNEPLVS